MTEGWGGDFDDADNVEPEPLYTLHWLKKWGDPICSPEQCAHSCTEVLTINQRLERTKRGQHKIHMDGSICMNCGADTTGHLSLVEGLTRCMAEHGWNRDVGLRLYDLAESNKDTICAAPPEGEVWPLWFLHAWGWTGREIVAALNRGAAQGIVTADAGETAQQARSRRDRARSARGGCAPLPPE